MNEREVLERFNAAFAEAHRCLDRQERILTKLYAEAKKGRLPIEEFRSQAIFAGRTGAFEVTYALQATADLAERSAAQEAKP